MANGNLDDKAPLSRSPSYQATCRRVKDCCAILHNSMQKWEGLNSESSAVANKLVNCSTEGTYISKGKVDLIGDNEELKKRIEGKLLIEREELYLGLRHLLSQMSDLVLKMATVTRNLSSTVELLTMQNEVNTPLFSSLTIGTYLQYAQDIFQAYSQELHLKQTIFDDILTQVTKDTVTVYLSCWVHQPFLTAIVSDNLEALLIDTGLRTS